MNLIGQVGFMNLIGQVVGSYPPSIYLTLLELMVKYPH